MSRFETLCQQIKTKRNLTASHKTRLERLIALYKHVSGLEAELAYASSTPSADPNWEWECATLRGRLLAYKPSSFFLEALEELADEVKDL